MQIKLRYSDTSVLQYTQKHFYSIRHYAALRLHGDWTVTVKLPLLTADRTMTTLPLTFTVLQVVMVAEVSMAV